MHRPAYGHPPLQLLDLGLELALKLLFLRGRRGLVHLLPDLLEDLLALLHRLEHTVDFALQLLCRRHGSKLMPLSFESQPTHFSSD